MNNYQIEIEEQCGPRQVSNIAAIAMEIGKLKDLTRRQVADIVEANGFKTHIGGRHVAILKDGLRTSLPVRVGLITNAYHSDWN